MRDHATSASCHDNDSDGDVWGAASDGGASMTELQHEGETRHQHLYNVRGSFHWWLLSIIQLRRNH